MSAARHEPREAAFTIIEVVVALLMLTIVSVAIAGAMSSAGNTQTRSKQRTQQVAMAQGGIERLQSDGGWARTAACQGALSPNTCSVTATAFSCRATPDAQGWCLVDLVQDSGATQTFRARAVSAGFDNAADGIGRGTSDLRDRDGVIPDYFRVSLEVQAPRPGGFDAQGAYSLVTDVSPPSRSNTGSVVVRACALTNQVDHRQPVIHCPTPGSIPMFAPVAFEAEWNREEERYDDDLDRSDSIDGVAFSAVAPDRRWLDFRPLNGVRYTLTPIDSKENPDPARPTVSGTTDAQGYGIQPYVVAGQYRIAFSGYPRAFVPWDDHSLPGDGFVSVGAGVATHVSQLFQPAPREVTLQFSHRTDEIFVTELPDGTLKREVVASSVRPGTEHRVHLRLIAAPLERVPVNGVNPRGRIVGDGVTLEVNPDDASATFENVAPGLYAAYVIAGDNETSDFQVNDIKGGRLDTQGQEPFRNSYPSYQYLWVGADGTISPGTAAEGDGDPTQIWYNTQSEICNPIPLCSGGTGGGGTGGSPPSGGGGGL